MAQDRNQKSGPGSRHVRDVMTPNPECVTERDDMNRVAQIMKEQDTGVVPVVDGKKVIGLITDRDIVVRGLAEGKDLATCRVNELMTRHVRSVRDDAPVDDVLSLMSGAEVRRIPVVNANDELVGIVSMGDIATNTNKEEKLGKTLGDISEAPPNN
ncbi:MAG TPA: CBS domain-containing protein [Thermoanaerobaculia bacterium]|nr:CBS domain-containing protein [Thermoanaerobaculia bacterium]